MAAVGRLLILVVSLLILSCTSSGSWSSRKEEDDEMRAMVRELLDQQVNSERSRGLFDCRKEHGSCRGVPACCGDLHCYWSKGFSLFESGTCVTCIREHLKCQRDDQCCPHLQCNKVSALNIDGTCQRYRREGTCYRDGQCVTGCDKKWYKPSGTCT